MTEDKLNNLIKQIAEYIIENAEKNPLLGIERDHALILAQEIGSRIYLEVLAKWKEKNGEKTNGKEKEKEAV